MVSTRKKNENGPASAKSTTAKATSVLPSDSAERKQKVQKKAAASGAKVLSKQHEEEMPCVCDGADDGTPMIRCDGDCQNWYHFRCVGITEDVAGEIEIFYCPNCEEKTGYRTTMDFEDMQTFKEPQMSKSTVEELVEVPPSEVESDGDGSEDDYVAETDTGIGIRLGRRPTRRLSASSEDPTGSDSDRSTGDGRRKHTGASRSSRTKRPKKTEADPLQEASGTARKRSSSVQQPAAKKAKAEGPIVPQDDPVRRYCLNKLEEIIRPMFYEYQDQQKTAESRPTEEEDAKEKGKAPEKPPSDDSEIDARVKQFVAELEQCMMDTYPEPDKTGKASAGGKYKERFRLLQFNLSRPDRVAVRKGIASGRIAPAQLNVMSSTDLADEQTKHEIQQAEKEALEHSILKKIAAPRAKITHKGFEAIEDMTGQRNVEAAKEEEEQRMEIEKRERERLARLRPIPTADVPPPTPTEPSPSSTGPTRNSKSPIMETLRHQPWGSRHPPPGLSTTKVDPPERSDPSVSSGTTRPPPRPLFIPSSSDNIQVGARELSLADIIHIEEEDGVHAVPLKSPQQKSAETAAEPTPIITSPSGPSPFAPAPAKSPDTQPQGQTPFNLNTLWTECSRKETGELDPPRDPTVEDVTEGQPEQEEHPEPKEHLEPDDNRGESMELESVDDYDDNALDAILQAGGSSENAPAPSAASSISFDNLPQVWTGEVCLPLEAPQNSLFPFVTCKQIGGRSLGPSSGYWQTLFPSAQVRIDGRVPIDSSTHYLVNSRLNPLKELIAVGFLPSSEHFVPKFNEVIYYLNRKERHALIFPWGQQPAASAPGKELYIIPLKASDPIPEYIELLDELELPKERNMDMLLGVFVLNKGKLSPSPPPLHAQQHSAFAATMRQTPLPTIQSFMPIPPVPMPVSTSVPSVSLPLPSQPAAIDQSALAAEVASLTPEQISLMLRHLSQTAALGQGPVPQPPVVSSTQFPMHHAPSSYPVPHLQTQQSQPQPPSALYHYQSHPIPPHYSPPPSVQMSNGHDHDYDRGGGGGGGQRPPFGHEGRGGRGARGRSSERGRRSGRGRGRAFPGDREGRTGEYKQSDQGWGSRGRAGGHPSNIDHRSRFAS